MTSFNVEQLKRTLVKGYEKNLQIFEINENVIRIDFSFKDSSFDNLIIYAIYDKIKDKITLTDDSYTVFDLENNGVLINHSKKLMKFLKKQLSPYGVEYNIETNDIYIETDLKNLYRDNDKLLQCLLFVNSMYVLSYQETSKKDDYPFFYFNVLMKKVKNEKFIFQMSIAKYFYKKESYLYSFYYLYSCLETLLKQILILKKYNLKAIENISKFDKISELLRNEKIISEAAYERLTIIYSIRNSMAHTNTNKLLQNDCEWILKTIEFFVDEYLNG